MNSKRTVVRSPISGTQLARFLTFHIRYPPSISSSAIATSSHSWPHMPRLLMTSAMPSLGQSVLGSPRARRMCALHQPCCFKLLEPVREERSRHKRYAPVDVVKP